MNEDSAIMEKKNFTPPSKKLDSSRNRQDGTGSHVDKLRNKPTQHQHFDGSNVPSASKAESVYKGNNSSKGKAFDKKPRLPRPREPCTQQNHPLRGGPEVGSLQAPGGKKQSAQNLLQFVLAPRERSQHAGNSYFGDLKHKNSAYYRSKHNNEQYLNGRCQFMVAEGGDYSGYEIDPDRLVDWNLVEQVYVRAVDEFPKCPICLEIPRAAKITKCGHIYCTSCMLHYFALSDGTYKSCPICFESIQAKEAKSVITKVCKDAKVGDHIEMRLMYRERGSLLIKQVIDREKLDSFDSKIIVISKKEVNDIIERELAELHEQHKEELQNPEVCFVEEAIRNAKSRQEMHNRTIAEYDASTKNHKMSACEVDISNGGGSATTSTNMYGQHGAGCDIHPPGGHYHSEELSSFEREKRERKDSDGSDSSEKFDGEDHGYYFYQASDGQNIYLHPINVAMIKMQFGCNPSNWPSFVNCVVLEIDDGSITEEKRKRHRFLSHLSIASAVKIIEVDVRPLISEGVQKEFSGQLLYREKRRVEKEICEKQLEKMYEELEKKKNMMQPKPKIESAIDFPICSSFSTTLEANFLGPLLTNESNVLDWGSGTETSPLAIAALSTGLGTAASGPNVSPTGRAFSFAQAAASFRTSVSSSGSRVQADVKRLAPHKPLTQTPKGEDDYAAPEYSSVISQEMAKAFANLDLIKEKQTVDAVDGSKKKGRKKGKVLFATGIGGFGGM